MNFNYDLPDKMLFFTGQFIHSRMKLILFTKISFPQKGVQCEKRLKNPVCEKNTSSQQCRMNDKCSLSSSKKTKCFSFSNSKSFTTTFQKKTHCFSSQLLLQKISEKYASSFLTGQSQCYKTYFVLKKCPKFHAEPSMQLGLKI
jgi:hypothetical protein